MTQTGPEFGGRAGRSIGVGPSRTAARLLLVGVGLCFLSLALPVPALAQDGAMTEFYHDFRGRPLPPELELFQVDDPGFIKEERAGMRITIPKTYEGRPYQHPPNGVGCQTSAPIRGDFDVSATVEFLDVEQPTTGGGAGVGLHVGAGNSAVQLRRLVGAQGRQKLLSSLFLPDPQKQRSPWSQHPTPCDENSIKLRMKRVGTVVYYFWAPVTGGGDFEEIDQFELGSQDLKHVRLFAFSNSVPCQVDVRLIDLRVRSGQAVVAAPAEAVELGALKTRTDGWLWAALPYGMAFLLLLAISFLCGWLYWRRGDRTGKQAAVAVRAHEATEGEARATALAFPCSGCGRELKVKAELAGKKVKCAQCGTVVLVPANLNR